MFKTYSKKAGEVTHKWVLIDGADVPAGRLATFVATRLQGRNDPSWTPHMDAGDHVVVINADKIALTGNKELDKKYYSYSGYPSGLKTKKAGDVTRAKVLESAVKGMLPKNKLQPERLKRLHIFAGETHEHEAQKPEKIEVK